MNAHNSSIVFFCLAFGKPLKTLFKFPLSVSNGFVPKDLQKGRFLEVCMKSKIENLKLYKTKKINDKKLKNDVV